jgi:ribonuclease III
VSRLAGKANLLAAVDMFAHITGYRFNNEALLETALTHRSLQPQKNREHYERLEFLGDAVLDLTIALLLIKNFPKANEGELSKMRAALVNTRCLQEIARDIDLEQYVLISRGERLGSGLVRPSILADVVEATIGAVFEDCENNLNECLVCIEKLFGDRLKNISIYDPKTDLQELLYASYRLLPTYHLEDRSGPEHEIIFTSVVKIPLKDKSGRIFEKVIGKGSGSSKKLSEREAAHEALEKIKLGFFPDLKKFSSL